MSSEQSGEELRKNRKELVSPLVAINAILYRVESAKRLGIITALRLTQAAPGEKNAMPSRLINQIFVVCEICWILGNAHEGLIPRVRFLAVVAPDLNLFRQYLPAVKIVIITKLMLLPWMTPNLPYELWVKLFVVHLTTTIAYCHLVGIREEPVTVWTLFYHLSAPLITVVQHAVALGIIAVFSLYLVIRRRFNDLKTIPLAFGWLFGRVLDDEEPGYSVLPTSLEQKKEPRGAECRISSIIAVLAFLAQCIGTIYLYRRRRLHDAVTAADQRVFELACSGTLTATLLLGNLLRIPIFVQHVPCPEHEEFRTTESRLSLFIQPFRLFNHSKWNYPVFLLALLPAYGNDLINVLKTESGVGILCALALESTLGSILLLQFRYGRVVATLLRRIGIRLRQDGALPRWMWFCLPCFAALLALPVAVFQLGIFSFFIPVVVTTSIIDQISTLDHWPSNTSCPKLWNDPAQLSHKGSLVIRIMVASHFGCSITNSLSGKWSAWFDISSLFNPSSRNMPVFLWPKTSALMKSQPKRLLPRDLHQPEPSLFQPLSYNSLQGRKKIPIFSGSESMPASQAQPRSVRNVRTLRSTNSEYELASVSHSIFRRNITSSYHQKNIKGQQASYWNSRDKPSPHSCSYISYPMTAEEMQAHAERISRRVDYCYGKPSSHSQSVTENVQELGSLLNEIAKKKVAGRKPPLQKYVALRKNIEKDLQDMELIPAGFLLVTAKDVEELSRTRVQAVPFQNTRWMLEWTKPTRAEWKIRWGQYKCDYTRRGGNGLRASRYKKNLVQYEQAEQGMPFLGKIDPPIEQGVASGAEMEKGANHPPICICQVSSPPPGVGLSEKPGILE
ncbi:uncharacterized protein BDR25DRAFT_394380 [Lindgomyces ingoldianus]|uniref:Uncharacterized protein n=1 Tax=Lindgomyces ingoldianus TaxID=673940 RepID=A0ACB6QT90_9PLEO|nr:uncharacterized protein BDR25DRAFT_394380 [Lindgomyces ingoldianus]KAF2469386.1 hypothetical protein BDR25DRAFT_394380 [Lindgomyces ingoldianus]